MCLPFLTQKPHAVLFDWDNTLVDSWLPLHKALEETFIAMGQKPWTLDQTRARVRTSARESFPLLFPGRAAQAQAFFYAAYERLHRDVVAPLSGAEGLLKKLQGKGCLLGVVSNKRGDLLRREVSAMGWETFFYAVVGANDASADKPARAVLDLVLAGTALQPGPRIWFVGDTDIDLRCAVLHGCRSILIRPDRPQSGEFEDCWPDAWFPDCHHFIGCLGF